MLEKFWKVIANDNELDSATLRILSLIFLLICGVMTFMEYTHKGFFGDSRFSFRPGLVSTPIGILLISPLYLRGVLKWNKSIYTLLSFILILLVFSSFVQLALGGDDKSNIVILLLFCSVLLSWLGIRAIAGISWVLAFAAGLYSIIVNDLTMGFCGFIYVSSGFIGLVLHSGLNPGELLYELKAEYSRVGALALETAKEDIRAAKEKIT